MSKVYLDGKLVDATVITPEKHKYIGIFRPATYDCACPTCGLINPNLDINLVKEHWDEGHFNIPQYQSIESKGIKDILLDYGLFQYCKFNPYGGIEAIIIEGMVNEYLTDK